MKSMEIVTYRAFDSACKRAEKKSLKLHGKTRTCIGQQHYLIKYGARIIGMQADRKIIILEGDWRSALDKIAQEAAL